MACPYGADCRIEDDARRVALTSALGATRIGWSPAECCVGEPDVYVTTQMPHEALDGRNRESSLVKSHPNSAIARDCSVTFPKSQSGRE